MKKLIRVAGVVLVLSMLFALMASCAFAIICDNVENVNEEGYIVSEKNGPTKSAKGYMAVGGEIRPEEDEPYDGVHIDDVNRHK